MHRLITIAVLGVLFVSAFSAAATEILLPQVTGRAIHQQSSEFLYTEMHACRADKLQCIIEYRDAAGKLLAVKELNYAEGFYSPVVSLREPPGRPAQVLARTDATVVDAGFDNYVRSQWDELVKGETITFLFQAFGFDRTFDMRAAVDEKANCEETQLCLRVEVDSWFLRLVAEPIALAYDRETRRLMRYRGVTNLRSNDLGSQLVDIRYTYSQ